MRLITILILLIFKSNTAYAEIETIICSGENETYECSRYDGDNDNLYNYSRSYKKLSVNVHGFDDSGTRNPDAPPDSDLGRLGDDSEDDSSEQPVEKSDPVFIPFDPGYLFPLFNFK
jgi:hypothetical protein